jgi:hypothetical protein
MQSTNSSWQTWRMIGAGAMLITSLACSKAADTAKSTAPVAPPAVAAAGEEAGQNPEDAMPRITAAETIALVKDGKAIVIDVRGSEAYKAAHTKGSIDFPLNKLEAGDFTGLPRDKRIVAYCT